MRVRDREVNLVFVLGGSRQPQAQNTICSHSKWTTKGAKELM